MARVRQRGTDIEIKLRRVLYAQGMRYRLQVPLLSRPRRVADIVFIGPRVAVFVDGCFWHGCPLHATWPKANADFWREKIEVNRARDADTDQRLRALGWEVVRIWEHESSTDAARRVTQVVLTRKRLRQRTAAAEHRHPRSLTKKTSAPGQ
jgi:DNA mismatch endonuclease (patch repair protein)